MFGEIVDGEMRVNECGIIVQNAWDDLPRHYTHIELDEFVIMPNHVHGIVVINAVTDQSSKLHGFSEIMRAFKSFSAKRINQLRDNPGCPVWQRNYFERVIRNEDNLSKAREYIINNPLKWEFDTENPVSVTHDR